MAVKDKNACLESKELQEVVDAVANDLGNEGRYLRFVQVGQNH
ncbi:MAG: hypothetical protein ACLTTH_16500 [Holdemanella porci]